MQEVIAKKNKIRRNQHDTLLQVKEKKSYVAKNIYIFFENGFSFVRNILLRKTPKAYTYLPLNYIK